MVDGASSTMVVVADVTSDDAVVAVGTVETGAETGAGTGAGAGAGLAVSADGSGELSDVLLGIKIIF